MPFENLVDIEEAARRLNRHPETVKEYIRSGELPAHKFSNKWWVDIDSLNQFATAIQQRRNRRKLI